MGCDVLQDMWLCLGAAGDGEAVDRASVLLEGTILQKVQKPTNRRKEGPAMNNKKVLVKLDQEEVKRGKEILSRLYAIKETIDELMYKRATRSEEHTSELQS